MSTSPFSTLALPAAAVENLTRLGMEHMTPIQAAALPAVLAGSDVIGEADTGSGKTLVFALGLLQQLDLARKIPQGIVLCPTRELARQIATEIRRFGRYLPNLTVTLLVGGESITRQRQTLKHGAHLVVGTPGRVKDLLGKDALDLAHIRTAVLDEADRMLEMGFIEDITAILATLPPSRQTLLFSATFPDSLRDATAPFLRHPELIRASHPSAHPDIEHRIISVEPGAQADTLHHLLLQLRPAAALIFANTIQTVIETRESLCQHRIAAAALHGDMPQHLRTEIIIQFQHRSCPYLVATDVAARGLDITDLPLVIQIDLPRQLDTYLHRAGRTGRAGAKGASISFCPRPDHPILAPLAADLGRPLKLEPPPRPPATPRNLPPPEIRTLRLAGGRKDKLRAGEMLGALTGDGGLAGTEVGAITLLDHATYIAINRRASSRLSLDRGALRIKGRRLRATWL